ncbi:MAG: hypothetical protein AAFU85_01435 [Planctomycetota bacterium]
MGALLDSFASWLVELVNYAIAYVWSWIFDRLKSLLTPLLESMLDALPDSMVANMEPIIYIVGVADYWLPLREGFTFLVAYWTFAITAGAIRIIIKIIPTVG